MGPHRAPSVAWQGHIRPPLASGHPLCGLARPHQAPLWPGKATSGQIRPPAGQIRPPAGRRKAGFCPDPAGAGVRKGRVGLSGPGWPRMLPARPLGPSGALLGPSRGPWGPKWAPGPPWGPPLGPSPIPPSGWPSYWPPSDGAQTTQHVDQLALGLPAQGGHPEGGIGRAPEGGPWGVPGPIFGPRRAQEDPKRAPEGPRGLARSIQGHPEPLSPTRPFRTPDPAGSGQKPAFWRPAGGLIWLCQATEGA